MKNSSSLIKSVIRNEKAGLQGSMENNRNNQNVLASGFSYAEALSAEPHFQGYSYHRILGHPNTHVVYRTHSTESLHCAGEASSERTQQGVAILHSTPGFTDGHSTEPLKIHGIR